MRPISLSATASSVYEACPARYEAEMLKKVQRSAGKAASLGTACHETLERWVADGMYLDTSMGEKDLLKVYDWAYWKNFADKEHYDDGVQMLQRWLERQDWQGRTVLSTEQKLSFPLHTSIGDIPFNYIRDRVDLLDNGDIEVIDYKTNKWAVSADELRNRIQGRAYALATWLEHPEARRIWVTYDLLRHDPIGVVFTAEECEATHVYLHTLAERIISDDSPAETINNECRFCVRKHECKALQRYVDGAGSTLVGDIGSMVATRAELDLAKKAIGVRLAELDEAIGAWLEGEDCREAEVGGFTVSLGSSRRRVIDHEKVAALLPPDHFAAVANVSLTSLDALLKSGVLDSGLASLVKQAISWRSGARSINVRPVKGA